MDPDPPLTKIMDLDPDPPKVMRILTPVFHGHFDENIQIQSSRAPG